MVGEYLSKLGNINARIYFSLFKERWGKRLE